MTLHLLGSTQTLPDDPDELAVWYSGTGAWQGEYGGL